MSVTSNRILTIYKSRATLMELLFTQGYDVEEYVGFSINEIDAMFNNSQLDMLVTHKETKQKTYVKYYLTAKQIRPSNLDDVIEDLYSIENVLTKKDNLIIVTEDEPNDTITAKMKYLYDHDGIFVVIHNINRLQYDITRHRLVPKCSILSDAEVEAMKAKFNIKALTQLPEISRFDPLALALSVRPGQVCEFTRESATAMHYKYYRVCI
jgi:DNA-directed RNA polymerase subunit H (RpoH/RPB5)